LKFNHIGYAVENLESSVMNFEILGYKASKTYLDQDQNINIILLEKNMSPLIELIHPLGDNNPLNRYLDHGQHSVPYHIAYEVNDIIKAVNGLRGKGFVPCMKISKAVAFNNIPFIFLSNPYTGLIELLEIND
jgi:methylmalonyl-CoA/ethylmalonyl-CoA epimerase